MTHELLSRPVSVEPAPRISPSSLLQRACTCPGGAEDCEECKTGAPPVQRRAAGSAAAIPPSVYTTVNRPGAPLDAATRGFMEPRFGHDFSRVRVHTDEQASASARAVNAHAYTFGNNIVFRSGRYEPGTAHGRSLLAHELAHVLQQNSGSPLPKGIDAGPSDPLEIGADAAAKQALERSHV